MFADNGPGGKPMPLKPGIFTKKRRPFYSTSHGMAFLADSMDVLQEIKADSINLIMTSPPFALVFEKEYGNVKPDKYVDWLLGYGREIHRVLREDGSFVLDIGGTWNKGKPTKSLYQFEALLRLCKEVGFHLAQDFYWYRPATLPAPAEWVTVRRIRVKDAVNHVYWLSKTENPKADNRQVLQPYSKDMLRLIKRGYVSKARPSGHHITDKFAKDQGGAIPSNVFKAPILNDDEAQNFLELGNNDSNGYYIQACRDAGIKVHPARFPRGIPEFFIKMLTEPGDVVLDPFSGSNVTGEAAENLGRKWIAVDLEKEYLEGAKFRFRQPRLSLAG